MYEQTIKLNHNEVPAKINIETGEIRRLKEPKKKLSDDKVVFEPDASFIKVILNPGYI